MINIIIIYIIIMIIKFLLLFNISMINLQEYSF